MKVSSVIFKIMTKIYLSRIRGSGHLCMNKYLNFLIDKFIIRLPLKDKKIKGDVMNKYLHNKIFTCSVKLFSTDLKASM